MLCYIRNTGMNNFGKEKSKKYTEKGEKTL